MLGLLLWADWEFYEHLFREHKILARLIVVLTSVSVLKTAFKAFGVLAFGPEFSVKFPHLFTEILRLRLRLRFGYTKAGGGSSGVNFGVWKEQLQPLWKLCGSYRSTVPSARLER